MLELIGINPQALDLFQFKIAEGTSPDQLKMEEKNEYMLYLGSAYKGIEVGKYYENQRRYGIKLQVSWKKISLF